MGTVAVRRTTFDSVDLQIVFGLGEHGCRPVTLRVFY
jgi:hypothetical protein